MFTEAGEAEFEKYSKWISDDEYDFSPDFVPTDETPTEAVEYYKRHMSMLVDFDAKDFKWPTGIGLNC